jgi:hypothetical protein
VTYPEGCEDTETERDRKPDPLHGHLARAWLAGV